MKKATDHPIVRSVGWRPEEPAERANDHILFSRGTSNVTVILDDDGDLVINCGMAHEATRHRERIEQLAGRPLKVDRIVLTQSHPDHIGGWSAFADTGVETIVQRQFPRLWAERVATTPFFGPRNMRVLRALMPDPVRQAVARQPAPAIITEPDNYTLVEDGYAFEQSGRRYTLLNLASGETTDSLGIWLPDERTLFTGNWMGALYGALPHFYTLRGDRVRSVPGFIADVERVMALAPDLMITGHDEPIVGADRILADLAKLRDAVRHIHDETLKGMNAQRDLPTLMTEIVLPDHLRMAPGRGPVSWYVRAVWEEYAGWFQHRSTTELYAVPPSAVWSELVGAAGGANAIADRAAAHVAAGRPVEALHLADMALASDPGHRKTLEAQRAALELLHARADGIAFDELGWLENELIVNAAALNEDA